MTVKQKLSLRKKVLFIFVIQLILILICEVGARTVFFVKEGFNPYYLSFGFVRDIEWHSDQYDGYTKFQPGSVMHQKVGSETIDMHINSKGYRSTYDFAVPKPKGVFRVATLGESSTFGYFSRDNETYPFQLEGMLRAAYPNVKIEVLNLGIPHFRMENILALARAELPELDPDVVTLYAGYNNSMVFRAREKASLLYRIKDWLYFHSVAWRTVHPLVKEMYYKVTRALNKDVAGLPNLYLPIMLSQQRIDEIRASIRQEFRAQVEELTEVVDRLGATLIVITQSYTLHNLRFGLTAELRGYGGEVYHVEELLRKNGEIPAVQSTLLIHRDLMDVLRVISDERGLPLVEGIDVLDKDRARMMASFVHLTPSGNTRIAEAIRAAIIAEHLLSTK